MQKMVLLKFVSFYFPLILLKRQPVWHHLSSQAALFDS